jgi:exonuclease III
MASKERIRVSDNLLALRASLDREIPAKTATDTLLLATWNIRKFGDNRSNESLHYLAEVMSRFDLIAIQEVSASMEGLQKLVSLLGHNWDYIVTDCTEGESGLMERMAFVYDRCKVFFRKMAGELVLPQKDLIGDDNLQFARTPFTVSFQAGWFKVILATVHIFYGKNVKVDQRRLNEISAVAKFISDRARKENENYILLGDFNIFNTGDATMKALEDHGFYIPEAIREHPSDYGKTKHYDQIAFKLKIDQKMTVFSENMQHAGAYNFFDTVYRQQDLDIYREYFDEKNIKGKTEKKIEDYYLQTWRTFQLSDHLPLWIELKVDFSDQYLKNIQ